MAIKLIVACIFLNIACFSQNSIGQFPSIAFVNQIKLNDSLNTNINSGCGFLLSAENEIYAVTSSKALSIIIKNNEQANSLADSINSWVMHVQNDSSDRVVCGEILNPVLVNDTNMNNDWCLLKVKTKSTKNIALNWRTSALVNGEPLYALGWSEDYLNSPQQTFIYTYIGQQENYIQMRRIIAPESDEMLWGAPVVDKEGLLVGIMSPRASDNKTGEHYSRACHVNVVIDFFKNRKN